MVKIIQWPRLSRYLTQNTSSDSIAQHKAQHPHIGFNDSDIVILDRTSSDASPLTSISTLTDSNIQHHKLEFSIDDQTISKLKEGY